MTRRSLARDAHDRNLRNVQKTALRYEPVRFDSRQIAGVARGFERAIIESAYVLLAGSILPEHVHMVVRRHHNRGEQAIGHFKARATQQRAAEELHPFLKHRDPSGAVPPAWASRGWKVFLSTDQDIDRSVRYVEENPFKQGLPRQEWGFVRGAARENAGS